MDNEYAQAEALAVKLREAMTEIAKKHGNPKIPPLILAMALAEGTGALVGVGR